MDILLDNEDSDDDTIQRDKESDEKNKENAELELKLATKRPRNLKPVNEDLLIGPDGLNRIYQEFPELCRFRGRGNEKQDLKR